MIIINLATIDFGGGGGSSKPLITEPLIANIWSRGRKVFTPADYNVDGFNDVTINTAIIGDNSALDFSIIGWDDTDSNNINSIYNADIEYSKELLYKWNNGEISNFDGDTKLVYYPIINTSNVTNMNYMFRNCTSLTTIPQLDTSNVTRMGNMFRNCTSLKTIPVFSTSNVIDMTEMFYSCESLTSIPLLDTSNVTSMSGMFSDCTSLITIPQLDTSNVTNMINMFRSCESLTSIPQLDTSNVNNMTQIFYYCKALKTIPELNTSNVTNVNSMFNYCTSLQSIPLLDFGKVTNINYFFSGSNITTLKNLGGFKDLKINWNDNYGLAKLPNLTYQSVMNVINNLYDFRANGDMNTTRTLKLSSNSYNLLTADDIALANGKGWNIQR